MRNNFNIVYNSSPEWRGQSSESPLRPIYSGIPVNYPALSQKILKLADFGQGNIIFSPSEEKGLKILSGFQGET